MDLSERISILENTIAAAASEIESGEASTKIHYFSAMLRHALKYHLQGSNELSLKLIEKVERAYSLFEVNKQPENQVPQIDSHEHDESTKNTKAITHFLRLRQDMQFGYQGIAGSKLCASDKQNDAVQLKTEAELQSFKQYQDMFEKMALDRLLSKVMKQIPENAGPLNPERLVIKSFKALQDISPEYLSRLISYYESLLTLQMVNSAYK